METEKGITCSEQDRKDVEAFRAGIHKEALKRLQRIDPGIREVVDRYPTEAFLQAYWDYPGKWYTVVAIPQEFRSRTAMVEALVRDTLSQRRGGQAKTEKRRPERSAPDAAAEQARRMCGKKLDVKHYEYEKLFTVSLDQKRRSCTLVGRDAQGRFILEYYEEHSLGSATGSVSEYYVLTDEEYRRYAKTALVNCQLSRQEYTRLRALADGPDGTVAYRDARYTLGRKDDFPYLRVDGKTYWLSCHPYEPCLFITDKDGDKTAVHNAFDPSDVLRDISKGRTFLSITGREYSARDFCEMVEYAAGRGNISISDAERVFVGRAAPARAVPAKTETAETAKTPVRETAETSAPETAVDPEPPLPEARPFSVLYADFPDAAADVYIVKDDRPCRGLASHRRALAAACRALSAPDDDGAAWRFDVERARGWPVSAEAPFACLPPDGELNFRRAVLDPPQGNLYDSADFDALCAALFPRGRSRLEVFAWSTDWSDYFDEGHEWWGALCYTIYDRSLDRYAVILASATD